MTKRNAKILFQQDSSLDPLNSQAEAKSDIQTAIHGINILLLEFKYATEGVGLI